ncbi:MAG TPA: hypothetical protein VEW03_09470, partial [Longimicrobiaceae bacterium]|nr:hypothetical protein [Longimicrobiaceae bacterium]
PSLERGYLPIPSVSWALPGASLTVTAFAAGPPEGSSAYLRYRVENTGGDSIEPVLLLALRPLQVNPPWQFLNVQGGVARVREVGRGADGVVRVEGRRAVLPLTAPDAFAAFPFDPGARLDEFARGGNAPATAASREGFASAALRYRLRVPPGQAREVWVGIPLHEGSVVAGAAEAPALLAATVRGWQGELGRMTLRLPAAAHGAEIANTLRSQLAYILINRDGPSIQPGSRSYDRSWIRDGSLTSAALLRLGHPAEVRAFAEWYAPHQRPSGYVPCCVSLRGADPVPEHDSHGQLVYLIAEYYRQTGDSAFLHRMWPHVQRAAAFIDSLRAERMTARYRTPERAAYYGLVPQSISHEGYSARPMHSYWDDFFALKGLEDAVFVAGALGEAAASGRIAASRDSLRRDLVASLALSMAAHNIAYLPGSVELGDFDATSTTVGLEPLDGLDFLPRAAVEATFERYYQQSIRARLDGAAWEAYTPYEWRTVGSFLRLGWKARAHEAIGLFLRDQRPQGWRQWAEVVFRDPRTPRFIGDMPHTWVGSDFIRSVLDLFAYTRAADQALVVGAGIPEAWAREAPGVELAGLRTPYGPLDLTLRASGSTVRARIGGGLRVPPGGIVLRSPLDRPLLRARVNGRPVPVRGGHEVVVRAVPARVEMEHP